MKRITVVAGIVGVLAATAVRAEGPTVSGFVDVGYNYNFNGQQTNNLRGFDDKANTITLQNAEIDVAGSMGDKAKYQVDLMYGYDATKTHSAGFEQNLDTNGKPVSNIQVDIQQAFMAFECPLTHGTITAGKFVTPFGAEVIEAKDDYNISRGLLFNYAIPFTHTGVKLDKGFSDGKYATMVGIVNGWDNMQDNNKGKTILAQVAANVLPKTSITVGGAYGPEDTPTASTESVNGLARTLVDLIVKVTPTDKLTLVANVDYGVEESNAALGLPDGFSPTSDNSNANWSGIAAYANYAFTDMFSLAARYEYLDDEGSRTGTEQILHSGTLTAQAKKDNMIYRLEYRQDKSTKKSFVDSDGLPDDTQSTVGVQMIYSF